MAKGKKYFIVYNEISEDYIIRDRPYRKAPTAAEDDKRNDDILDKGMKFKNLESFIDYLKGLIKEGKLRTNRPIDFNCDLLYKDLNVLRNGLQEILKNPNINVRL